MPIWAVQPPAEYVTLPAKRRCGGCEVCCEIPAIYEGDFQKPPRTPCPHQCGGCALYGKAARPENCRDFSCAWMRGFGDDKDRPDRSGVMCHINAFNGGVWIFVLETRQGGFQDGQRVIIDLVRRFDLPAILVRHDVTFPDDKGDYTVVKDELLSRTERMRGDLVRMLTNDIGLYELASP